MKKIQDLDLKGKRILLRTGFDVPIEDFRITDDKRIRDSLDTINFLLQKEVSQITIVTHLGRPSGHEDEFCLWPIANRLAELLNIQTQRYDCAEGEYKINDKITLLENIRFNAGEETNDPELIKKLAGLADVFINDAFSVLHREHASTYGIAKVLPSYAGLLVQKEVEVLSGILSSHVDGFTVILGGAKIEDKLPVVQNLISRADNFLIGGAIGNTFLAARGKYSRTNEVDKEMYRKSNIIWDELMTEADKNIFLPQDVVLSKSQEQATEVEVVAVGDLNDEKYKSYYAVDIGPKTQETFKKIISKSEMIFLNGNMGISEIDEFSHGTLGVVEAIANCQARKYAGGGDTTAFIRKNKLEDKFDFLSTGGGATLEFLAGKMLPGLEILK